jgi:hypothetical protein
MTRQLLPYFNASVHGQGMEGAVNYSNAVVGNLFIPAFLIAIYIVALYVWSKSDFKMGGGIFFISFVLFLMAIIAQTFATFNQIVIFIFVVGMIVGIVLFFIESAKG